MRTITDSNKKQAGCVGDNAPRPRAGIGTINLAIALTLWLCLGPALHSTAQAIENLPSVPLPQLYRELREVGLDGQRIYRVRDANIEREDIHISLQDGTIGFTVAVNGKVTGAFFQGEGEILMIPPNQAERASLALFTHAAVLEERFTTAYFRFSDDMQQEMAGTLRPAENAAEFLTQWNPAAKSLAESDALRLLAVFSNLPTEGEVGQRLFHARLSGLKLGTFDVLMDTGLAEQIFVAQTGTAENGSTFYDAWMSFPMRSARQALRQKSAASDEQAARQRPLEITAYKIQARVQPPHQLQADADLTVRATLGGEHTLLFELSRNLKVSTVEWQGKPVEFLQNAAIPGSQLARRSNDVMAVLLPQSLPVGAATQLTFHYEGDVLTEAGGGLMYVGARGAWYPNRGAAMAQFDLQFRNPAAWTLLATGKRVSLENQNGEQLTHWVSEHPIPLAGFNLGEYVTREAAADGVTVATYAARGVEDTLKKLVTQTNAPPDLGPPGPANLGPVAPPPSPTEKLKPVEERAVETLGFFSERLGRFPYSSLALTQMPGPDSQGWPGLIFLSSFVFVPPDASMLPPEMDADYEHILYDRLMPAHEIAHQWWGDAVLWKSYRDQWLMEALANYMALLQLESAHPEQFKKVMERYRQDLLRSNPEHRLTLEAGPVTLGIRLSSSQFPNGYEVVAYERGSWLIHMLRCSLRAAAAQRKPAGNPDAAFIELLRHIQERYAGAELSTEDLQRELEAIWPAHLRFENKPSLDWFFSGWVNGTAVPALELKEIRITQKRGITQATATGTIVQSEAPDDLVTLVPIYAQSASGVLTPVAQVFADGPETSFRIPVPATARKLVLDPNLTLLRRP